MHPIENELQRYDEILKDLRCDQRLHREKIFDQSQNNAQIENFKN